MTLHAARRVPAVVGLSLWFLNAVFAQDSQKPGQINPRLDAFDSEIVGKETVAYDEQAASVTEVNYRLYQWQEVVDHDTEALAAERGKTGGGDPEKITTLTQELDIAKGNVDVLQKQREIVLNDKDCGNGSKVEQMKTLHKMVSDQIDRMDPVIAQMKPLADKMKTLPNPIAVPTVLGSLETMEANLTRYRSLEKTLRSQLYILEMACVQAKDERTDGEKARDLKWLNDNLEKATAPARRSAVEARALARGGRAQDLEPLREMLAPVVQAARINELLGRDDGPKLQGAAEGALLDYAAAITKTCKDEEFTLQTLIGLQLQSQKLGGTSDLSSCLNRMLEVNGAVEVPFQMRHCGIEYSGLWKVRVPPGSNWDIKGEVTIDGDSGMLDVHGMSKDKMTKPYPVSLSGPLTVSKKTDRIYNIDVMVQYFMLMKITRSAIVATPAGGGMPTPHPASTTSLQQVIGMVSNKACDPDAPDAAFWAFK